MMHIDDFSLYFQRVPYLSIEKASAQRVEFLFRGAAGRAQRCALGAVFALAFPCNSGRGGQADNPPPAQIQQAHRLSLLLASSAFALDLGLQHEGCFWLLWKRFDPEAVQTPDAVLPRSTIWSTSCVFYITDVLKCRAVAVTAICVIRLKQRNLPRNAGKKCGEKHWNIRRRRVVLRSDARRLDANAPSLERAAVFHGHARRKGLRDAAGHRRELWRSHYCQRAGGRLFHWHDSQRDAGRDSAPLCAIVQSRDVLRWPGALCL